jgi:hypothetical protein
MEDMFAGISLDASRNSLLSVELISSSLSYSICCDINHHILPGFQLETVQNLLAPLLPSDKDDTSRIYLKYSPGNDDLKLFENLLYGLSEMILLSKQETLLLNSFLYCLIGKSSTVADYSSDNVQWITYHLGSLLLLPLFDTVVMLCAFNKIAFQSHLLPATSSSVSFSFDSPPIVSSPVNAGMGNSFDDSFIFIYIAKLIQLLLHQDNHSTFQSVFPYSSPKNTKPTSSSSSSSSDSGDSFSSFSSLNNFLELLIARIAIHYPQKSYDSSAFALIFTEWLMFLRSVLHLFSRLTPSPHITRYLKMLQSNPDSLNVFIEPLSPDSLTDDIIRLHCEAVGLEWILDSGLKTIQDSPSLQLFVEIIDSWLNDYVEYQKGYENQHSTTGQFLIAHNSLLPFYCLFSERLVYPNYQSFKLIDVPNDYSKLHSKVLSKCSFDYPALCLFCGAVMNASGKGQCHAHVYKCGAGVGIFFLIQVDLSFSFSIVLLIFF